MVKAVRDEMQVAWAPCANHTLALCINDCIFEQRYVKDIIAICRNIVSHFNRSPLSYNALKMVQESNNNSGIL